MRCDKLRAVLIAQAPFASCPPAFRWRSTLPRIRTSFSASTHSSSGKQHRTHHLGNAVLIRTGGSRAKIAVGSWRGDG